MNRFAKTTSFALLAGISVFSVVPAQAQDAMKKNDSMKTDTMKSDTMKKDSMKNDAMKGKDSMKSGSDSMSKGK